VFTLLEFRCKSEAWLLEDKSAGGRVQSRIDMS
jgi:hypothetical protein